jgi:hypothetical protein
MHYKRWIRHGDALHVERIRSPRHYTAGERVGRLVVLGYVAAAFSYECLCDCGTPTLVTTSNLNRGITQSCGCLQREVTDLGERPDRTFSVDRIDNDGPYSCGHCEECGANGWHLNCRWATPLEQASHRRPRRSY